MIYIEFHKLQHFKLFSTFQNKLLEKLLNEKEISHHKVTPLDMRNKNVIFKINHDLDFILIFGILILIILR